MAQPAEPRGALLWQGLNVLRPTLFLFLVDTLANAVDYGFHIYLGRSLAPGDFAAFQAVNAALLIAVTAFGVMQPVLARFVAAAETGREAASVLSVQSRTLFQTYFSWSLMLGLALGLAVLVLDERLGRLLNIPAYAVRYGAVVLLLVLLRPVVAGTLQGGQRFLAFGATRLAFALGRFGFAALVLSFGAGLAGAVASLPVGQCAAVLLGLAFLGYGIFRRPENGPADAGLLPAGRLGEGLRLAGWAFFAYAAFTALQNLDLLWVNRTFPPGEAGAYASAVLLRRILVLFPAAAAVVMYPRVAAAIERRKMPDRQVAWTLLFVSGAVAGLVVVYAAAGPWIVALAFGSGYAAAGPLLGWMGVGTLGFAFASIWLNVFLATRPGGFVLLLTAVALIEAVALTFRHGSLLQVTAVFGAGGWMVAVGGLLIYIFRLRPRLKAGFE